MKLIRYEYPQLQGNRLFDRFFDLGLPGFERVGGLFNDVMTATGYGEPAVDLYEDDHNYFARLELPGIAKKDLDIELENAVLTVTGKTAAGKGKEASEATFTRSVSVPDGVNAEAVSAAYEDGVLTVTLPKQENRKPRQIAIK